jgi:hypothetical protein
VSHARDPAPVGPEIVPELALADPATGDTMPQAAFGFRLIGDRQAALRQGTATGQGLIHHLVLR